MTRDCHPAVAAERRRPACEIHAIRPMTRASATTPSTTHSHSRFLPVPSAGDAVADGLALGDAVAVAVTGAVAGTAVRVTVAVGVGVGVDVTVAVAVGSLVTEFTTEAAALVALPTALFTLLVHPAAPNAMTTAVTGRTKPLVMRRMLVLPPLL